MADAIRHRIDRFRSWGAPVQTLDVRIDGTVRRFRAVTAGARLGTADEEVEVLAWAGADRASLLVLTLAPDRETAGGRRTHGVHLLAAAGAPWASASEGVGDSSAVAQRPRTIRARHTAAVTDASCREPETP